MFDTVIVNCPECNEEHEFQSKSGECSLRFFTLDECPDDVLMNVNRHAPRICECGTEFEVDLMEKKPIIL